MYHLAIIKLVYPHYDDENVTLNACEFYDVLLCLCSVTSAQLAFILSTSDPLSRVSKNN